MKRLLLSGMLFCCACTPQDSTQTTTQPIKAPSVPTIPHTIKPIVSQRAPEGKVPFDKVPDVTSTMYVQDVDSKTANAHPKLNTQALSEALRQALGKAVVPVLLPNNPALLKRAVPTYGKHWFAVTMKDDTHSVYVQGTRTRFEFDQIELGKAGDQALKKPYQISKTHQIITISFERFGVGYGIDIECAKPIDDERCTKEDYAHHLMTTLGVASPTQGGTP